MEEVVVMSGAMGNERHRYGCLGRGSGHGC